MCTLPNDFSVGVSKHGLLFASSKDPRRGASNTPFTRWLPVEYDDGISQPKGWNSTRRFNNFLLPLVTTRNPETLD